MSVPILYGLTRSVYTRIARLALEEKGIAYDLEEVEIFGAAGVPERHLDRQPGTGKEKTESATVGAQRDGWHPLRRDR